jgi:hypothetical protein
MFTEGERATFAAPVLNLPFNAEKRGEPRSACLPSNCLRENEYG